MEEQTDRAMSRLEAQLSIYRAVTVGTRELQGSETSRGASGEHYTAAWLRSEQCEWTGRDWMPEWLLQAGVCASGYFRLEMPGLAKSFRVGRELCRPGIDEFGDKREVGSGLFLVPSHLLSFADGACIHGNVGTL